LELYADRFKNAKDARGLRSLGRLLLRDALSAADTDTRFVMLNESVALSESIGDLTTAVEAIREMESTFEVDFWKLARESVDDAAQNPHKLTSADYKKTLEELIQEALDLEAFEDANWLVGRAVTIARRAGDLNAVESYLKKRKEIQAFEKLTVAQARAVKTLGKKPDDGGANQDRGDYLFVVKDDLDGALEHWQLSNDQVFNNIARLQSQFDRANVESLLELAEAWYDIGRSNRSLRDYKCLQRSLKYFEDAEASVEGLDRRKIEKKIQQIREGIE
jgi:tetratricopeptide (TPR) repeat protein